MAHDLVKFHANIILNNLKISKWIARYMLSDESSMDLKKIPFLKPRRFIIINLVAVFSVEAAIMVFLSSFHSLTPLFEAILDGILLTSITLPYLYFFLYKPLVKSLLEREHAELVLQQNYLYDRLTSLPNRILFEDRLHQQTLTAERNKSNYGLFVLKIHHLAAINDAIGYKNGDIVIEKAALRLRYDLRKSDTFARTSNNEFTFLLPLKDVDDIHQIAEKILRTLGKTITLEDTPITLEGSIGIATYPQQGTEPTKLLQKAELAMRGAYKSISGYSVYNTERDPNNKRRVLLFNHLKEAIENKRDIVLYYQPKVNIFTGKIESIEALARWNHESLGTISPEEFVPLAEHSGLIKPFTLMIIESAFKDQRKFKEMGINITMAINLSSRNIQDTKLPNDISTLQKAMNIIPSEVDFEITESAFMDNSHRAIQCVETLTSIGFGISLDDYGKDYSSLSYLSRLPVSTLKIDKDFITNMDISPKKTKIVKSTIAMAHSLNLKVIAEGVEDKETLARLRTLNCDMVQGYVYSKPLPLEQFCDYYFNKHKEPNLFDEPS